MKVAVTKASVGVHSDTKFAKELSMGFEFQVAAALRKLVVWFVRLVGGGPSSI